MSEDEKARPYRGVLYGTTAMPGFERPVFDGELCDCGPDVPNLWCDHCDSWMSGGEGWLHTALYSVCPACRPGVMRGHGRYAVHDHAETPVTVLDTTEGRP